MHTNQPQGTAGQGAAWLRLASDGSDPIGIELRAGRNLVGRAVSSDIQIEDATLSERHCEIELTPQGVVVRDLGSTNGTFVDGEPVREAVLKPGQTLRLGGVELLLEQPRLDEALTPPSPFADNASRPRPNGTTCANHLRSPATWICTDCRRHFCAACIKQVKLDANKSVTLCKSCDGLCERLNEQAADRSEAKSFIGGLIGALWYPLDGTGAALLIGGALLQLLIGMLGFYALPLSFGAGVYILGFMRQILLSSIQGETAMPGWPELDIETLREAALQFIAVGLVSFGPATVCRIWLSPEADSTKFVCDAFFVAGACYFPIALLGVIIYDSLAALNPLLVVLSILKVPLKYCALCLLLGGTFGLSWVAEAGLTRTGTPLVASLVGAFASLYSTAVAMRAIGWFYFCSEDPLDWR